MTRTGDPKLDSETATASARPGGQAYCVDCDLTYPRATKTCPVHHAKLIRLQPTQESFAGRRIDDRYEIKEKLGEGGMGVVYRAWQFSIGRDVAIKIIDAERSRDPMSVRRFLREARLASQLSQPNTVSVFDVGQLEDGHLYIVMELVRGRTLAQVLQDEGAFEPPRAIAIGLQLCDALDAAHRLGIVHRDLKPSNIMVLDDPPGRDLLKVLDFGVAKLMDAEETQSTISGVAVGTPRYMSPEASLGMPVDGRSDLYSLGIVLAELFAGESLFAGKSLEQMLAEKTRQQPALPSQVPPSVAAVLSRLLRIHPAERYGSADEVRRALVDATRVAESSRGSQLAAETADATVRSIDLTAPSLELGQDQPHAQAPDGRAGHRRGRSWWVWLALATLVVGGGSIAVLKGADQDPRAPAGASSSAADPSHDAGSAAPRTGTSTLESPPSLPMSEAASASGTSSVQISLSSRPNAEIWLAGELLGSTPKSLAFSASDTAVVLTFRRAGYRQLKRRVVPNRGQRVSVQLAPRARRRSGTPGADKSPTSGKDELPTSGKDELPTSGTDKLPTSGTDKLPSSEKDKLPSSEKADPPSSAKGDPPVPDEDPYPF